MAGSLYLSNYKWKKQNHHHLNHWSSPVWRFWCSTSTQQISCTLKDCWTRASQNQKRYCNPKSGRKEGWSKEGKNCPDIFVRKLNHYKINHNPARFWRSRYKIDFCRKTVSLTSIAMMVRMVRRSRMTMTNATSTHWLGMNGKTTTVNWNAHRLRGFKDYLQYIKMVAELY